MVFGSIFYTLSGIRWFSYVDFVPYRVYYQLAAFMLEGVKTGTCILRKFEEPYAGILTSQYRTQSILTINYLSYLGNK